MPILIAATVARRARSCRATHAATLLAAAIALAGWLTNSLAAPPAKTVDIAKFAFVPKEITVEPGTLVRWTNHDETPHTVTSLAAVKVFASKAMDTDDHFEFTFTKEGDYAYFCTVHPMMTAVVHVRKAAR